jgi:hypothetical protein
MTWREPQPGDVPPLWDDLPPDEREGEPDTIDDEFAKDDVPDQTYEDDV